MQICAGDVHQGSIEFIKYFHPVQQGKANESQAIFEKIIINLFMNLGMAHTGIL